VEGDGKMQFCQLNSADFWEKVLGRTHSVRRENKVKIKQFLRRKK